MTRFIIFKVVFFTVFLQAHAENISKLIPLHLEHQDPHSYSNAHEVSIHHADLDFKVDFDQKVIQATATLSLDFKKPDVKRLVLDTRALNILSVEKRSFKQSKFEKTAYKVGDSDPILGAPLFIKIDPTTSDVKIEYKTSPKATALQWLEKSQTTSQKYPFLFTQSQAIHARSWIPIQDTPDVRQTYTATVTNAAPLVAVMSAAIHESELVDDKTRYTAFRMPEKIPAYLFALSVGELVKKSIGDRVAIYAEPSVVDRAAKEFEDTETMLVEVEKKFGPYRWGRYDLLVLPPSFPYGGMENPRMSFITPTVIAGDKSLVSLIAHELAHSWSGNLVTNANWSDLWINEGFTSYLDMRVMEMIFGKDVADLERVLSQQSLKEELLELDENVQKLKPRTEGLDPDMMFSSVPYIKGQMMLEFIEHRIGREAFDQFLKQYFNDFAFQSITTDILLDYLDKTLLKNTEKLTKADLLAWIFEPGLPDTAVFTQSKLLDQAAELAKAYSLDNNTSLDALLNFPAMAIIYFIQALPDSLSKDTVNSLDQRFGWFSHQNAEIQFIWHKRTLAWNVPNIKALNKFLEQVGRMKFIVPLYKSMIQHGQKAAAAQQFDKVSDKYHPVAQKKVRALLNP